MGYSPFELSILSLYEVIVEGKENVFACFENSKEIEDIEIVLVNKQGDKKYCVLSASREKDNNDETYIQGILHDITNLKRAEKATLQAEKLAATGRLVRTLAHEVRNPLSNIQMSVEQLKSINKSDDETLFLDIITRNAKRINDLITELLDSSRPTELVFKRVVLQNVLDQSINEALDRITLQHIKLIVSYPDAPCYVQADADKLNVAAYYANRSLNLKGR